MHLGEYTSFSYELPEELLQPVNTLTVRVTDSLDPDRPRGKQESHVFKRGGIWYQAISGPVRSVWLEPVERNRLRTRLSVVSQVAERLVEFGVTTRVRDAGTYRLHLVVAALDDPEPCAIKDIELVLEAGERRQYVVVHIPDARPWSPAAPALYRIVAQLRGPDGHVSQIETRIGLRELTARGRCLYLNGEPIYLDGVLYQPGTSTFDEMRQPPPRDARARLQPRPRPHHGYRSEDLRPRRRDRRAALGRGPEPPSLDSREPCRALGRAPADADPRRVPAFGRAC